MSNSKNKKPSTNTDVKKIIEINPLRNLGKAKNGQIATHPPPKPAKAPKQ